MTLTENHVPCAAFIEALKADRQALNGRFVERRVAGCQIDAEAFLHHLATVVAPIVCEIASVFPERARLAVGQLYDVSLELFGASLLGPAARIPEVEALWRRLLPSIPKALARDPARLVGKLSNAVVNVASQSGTRPEWWISRMVELAPQCETGDDMLSCGKFLAWQAGMAQYRVAALEVARKLPQTLKTRMLNLHSEMSPATVVAVIERLASDPWLSVADAAVGRLHAPAIECVREIGAFRGFGGPFVRPPTVSYADGSFWAGDGERRWQFFADEFGSYFHAEGGGHVAKNEPAREVRVQSNGTVHWQDERKSFPFLAAATSFACDGATLAATIPTSHHVFLLARR
jgi:hypothetical protein